jgi:predicted acetyltransferase
MKNIERIKYSTDEKHTKLLNFMRAWAKRKQDRQEQVWKDYEEGKYDEWLKKLGDNKVNSNNV